MYRKPCRFTSSLISFFTIALIFQTTSVVAATNTSIVPIINYVLQSSGKEYTYPPNAMFTSIANVENTPYPAFMVPTTGQTFGNTITRITDSPTVVFDAPYSKVPAWNSDGTLLMVYYRLLDGNTYQTIATNTFWESDERKWSATQPNIFYAMEHNYDLVNAQGDIVQSEALGDGTYDHIFVERDVSVSRITGATPPKNRLIYFSGADYSHVYMGRYEGNIDHQDRFVVFAARKTGEDYLTAVVYDIHNDTSIQQDLTHIKWFIDEGTQNVETVFDWISVSPTGRYILVNWLKDPNNPSNPYRASIDQYDIDLNFIRELSAQGQHGDIGLNSAGKDVYVQYEFANRSATWMYDLDTGAETQLLPDKYNGGHVSCRNYKRPGWCYLSAKQSYHREVYAVKLDSSHIVNRFAQTHVVTGGSGGTVSPDGTKILFISDWNDQTANDAKELFVVEVPQ
ncbi:MAG: hypothetical protein KAG20_11510 [Cocleimonas sp.]|nr:hypothetical protein [Cocleimonas sp.]